MTATFLEHMSVDRITERARAAHLVRVLLTTLAGLLFGAGWVASKVFTAVWFALAWCAIAAHEGWRAAASHRARRTD